MGNFKVRTDLALEARERYGEEDIKLRGVRVEEHTDQEKEIHTTTVVIETENGARAMGKPVGTYITIEAANMSVPDEDYHREISGELAQHVQVLLNWNQTKAKRSVLGMEEKKAEADSVLGMEEKKAEADSGVGMEGKKAEADSGVGMEEKKAEADSGVGMEEKKAESDSVLRMEGEKEDSALGKISGKEKRSPETGKKSVLVVGLGNRDVTPDALGPYVVGNLHITRHMIREYGRLGLGLECAAEISAIAPGVMAQTGMETLEIIKGVVETTKPDVVIVIDALAARSTRRLNRTIQITDTGINPGSGVGNHRNAINRETLGVPVIAVGVPTVVDAATIVNDTMEELIAEMDRSAQLQRLGGMLGTLNQAEKHQMIHELISPHLNTMFVTPKDIDETVKYLSYTISEGLNMAFA